MFLCPPKVCEMRVITAPGWRCRPWWIWDKATSWQVCSRLRQALPPVFRASEDANGFLRIRQVTSAGHDLIVRTQDRRREQQQQVRREKHAQAAAPPPATKEAGHVCNFLMPDGSKCSFTASTPHYLRVHKEQMGHRRKRSAPTGDQTGKRRKP